MESNNKHSDIPVPEKKATNEEKAKASHQHLHLSPCSSPPNKKPMSLESIMETSKLATNLTLAHEIAMDPHFQLEEAKPITPSSPREKLHSAISETMERAFWDVLRTDIESDIPVYTQAFVLLKEIKEMMLDLLPHNRVTSVHKRINDLLDIELLEQQADNDALNIKALIESLIETMLLICSPNRDEEIKALYKVTDIVDMFRETYKMIQVLRKDLANYYITISRPVVQQNQIIYERNKFAEIMDKLDNGLPHMTKWIENSYLEVKEQMENGGKSDNKDTTISPVVVLDTAYMQLLDWDNKQTNYPETLFLDQKRFISIQEEYQKLILVTSLVLTSCSVLGSQLASDQSYIQKIKDDLLVVVPKEMDAKNLTEILESSVEQIWSVAVKKAPSLLPEKKEILKSQILALSGLHSNPVYTIIAKRGKEYMAENVASYANNNKVSPQKGFHFVQNEFSNIATEFAKLTFLNKNVYGPFYVDIMKKLLDLPSAPNTPTTSPRRSEKNSTVGSDSKAKKKLNLSGDVETKAETSITEDP